MQSSVLSSLGESPSESAVPQCCAGQPLSLKSISPDSSSPKVGKSSAGPDPTRTAHTLWARLIPDLNAPPVPLTVDTCASSDILINLGIATTARIPSIMITTTSSIKVKPAALLFLLLWLFITALVCTLLGLRVLTQVLLVRLNIYHNNRINFDGTIVTLLSILKLCVVPFYGVLLMLATFIMGVSN